MAETVVTDAGDYAKDADVEMTDDIVIKEEIEPLEPRAIEGDDDDVVIMPTEEPVVTEILDETDIRAAEDLHAIDDDVMSLRSRRSWCPTTTMTTTSIRIGVRLDVKVNVMDNNWPITAKIVPKSVHVNPNFLMVTHGYEEENW